eukprot:COSAG02_NODE_7072_length_3199_cov_528.647419_2_plen_135_part_00
MKLCGDGGGHVRGLPAGFQCGAQGVLRDTGREVLGAARGRESENERKFEKRPIDASASAGCTSTDAAICRSFAACQPFSQSFQSLPREQNCNPAEPGWIRIRSQYGRNHWVYVEYARIAPAVGRARAAAGTPAS